MTIERNVFNIYKVFAIAASTLLFACGGREPHPTSDMMVTIAPLKQIVEQITVGDFEVGVLVPTGASPETFDPTPRQMAELSDAKLLFSTGLIEFEQNLIHRIGDGCEVVNLSHGIDLIEGHSHGHSQADHSHEHHAEAETHAEEHHAHSHAHGIDPHIWTSPRELKTMARNAYEAIIEHYPDSVKYTEAYNSLSQRLEALDKECQAACENSATTAFIIYHPALSYFARAYGIEQIAVEEDGKEPSARHIANLIDRARTQGIGCLLYQSQFPRSVVDIIARDMGVEAIEIDPLREDVMENIREITRLITMHNK